MSETTTQANTEATRNSAASLYTFLKEFTALRTKTVRSIDEYEDVLWFSNVPREPECDCAAWHRGQGHEDAEIWLEIRQPPLVPHLSRPCSSARGLYLHRSLIRHLRCRSFGTKSCFPFAMNLVKSAACATASRTTRKSSQHGRRMSKRSGGPGLKQTAVASQCKGCTPSSFRSTRSSSGSESSMKSYWASEHSLGELRIPKKCCATWSSLAPTSHLMLRVES